MAIAMASSLFDGKHLCEQQPRVRAWDRRNLCGSWTRASTFCGLSICACERERQCKMSEVTAGGIGEGERRGVILRTERGQMTEALLCC